MQRLNLNLRLVARLVLRYIVVWIADAVSVAITALLMPGIYFVRDASLWFLTPFLVALLFGLLNALVRPVLIILLLPITFVTLGLATLLLNASLFYLMDAFLDSFVIESFGGAVAGVLLLTLVNTLLGNLIKLRDDYSFYAVMMNKFSTLTRPRYARRGERGLVLLQIDGLSYESLKAALRAGKMPYLNAMIKRRTAGLRKWFSGLPAQTSAVQAGMFYGDRFDIPGFRWYDKRAGKLFTSSNSGDMASIDARFSAVKAPLLENGTCINSLIHGGAAKKILTVSALSDKDLKHHRGSLEDFAIFSLHPYLYTRTLLLMVWDFLVDRVETYTDLIRRKKPKLTRSIKFSFLRAVGNAFFREAATYFIMEDIVRGIPVIYANYLGYDMVAHYGGPKSRDAINTLAGIDRQIRKLGRMIRRKAPKHYDLVVLSDHGQTRCVPFTSLYNKSLPQTIEDTLKQPSIEPGGHTAELGYFNTLLREIRRVEEAYGTRSIRSSRTALERLHRRIQEEYVESKRHDGVVVCANGNLAHVYLTETTGRATTEYLLENHPTLLESLVAHEGIGFIVTTNAQGDHLMMSKGGMRKLRTGVVEGDDPVLAYANGVTARIIIDTLIELCGYPNSGDIVLNGALRPDGTVVSFEPQRGTHGGLGGEQTDAFVIFPRRSTCRRQPLRNPNDMHRFLASLLAH
jgi:uncharacterized membrane protein YvlD (DUF360 family)